MKALHDIVESGKVRYIGAGSMCAHELLELQYTARLHGWIEFISMQNLHNATYREEEKEMVPSLKKFGSMCKPSPVSSMFLLLALEISIQSQSQNFPNLETLSGCKANFAEVGMVPWSPLAMSYLARPHEKLSESSRSQTLGKGFWRQAPTEADQKINKTIEEIAKKMRTTTAIVATAWSLSKPFMTAPIIGMSGFKRRWKRSTSS